MIKNAVLRYIPFYIKQNKNGHVHKLRLVKAYVGNRNLKEFASIAAKNVQWTRPSLRNTIIPWTTLPLGVGGGLPAVCLLNDRPRHMCEKERESAWVSETETGLRLTEGSPQSRSCTSASLSRVSQWTSLSMYHPRRTICLECRMDGTCVAVFAFCMHKYLGFVSSDLSLDNSGHLL